MKFEQADFNGFANAVHPSLIDEVHSVLTALPLYVTGSEQRGKAGNLIFDPKGTNRALQQLLPTGWHSRVPIPPAWQILGKDLDFGKRQLVLEAQFSNYPFLTNNIIRTHIFFVNRLSLTPIDAVSGLVIVTKTRSVPSSNSTLYYEQAVEQVALLLRTFQSLSLPIRVIGLTIVPEDTNQECSRSILRVSKDREL